LIVQKVKIAKQETEDGMTKIEAPIGTEFWVVSGSAQIKRMMNRETKQVGFQWVVAFHEDPNKFIPVELLEFSNSFKAV